MSRALCNFSNISKISYQHFAVSRQPVFIVGPCISKIMRNRPIKAGEFRVKQYSSDTVMFIVFKNIVIIDNSV